MVAPATLPLEGRRRIGGERQRELPGDRMTVGAWLLIKKSRLPLVKLAKSEVLKSMDFDQKSAQKSNCRPYQN